RRHTRFSRDWSSDVCSSDLAFGTKYEGLEQERYDLLNYDKVLYRKPWIEPLPDYVSSKKRIDDLTIEDLGNSLNDFEANTFKGRSEERRVGKERRCRWTVDQ